MIVTSAAASGRRACAGKTAVRMTKRTDWTRSPVARLQASVSALVSPDTKKRAIA
jgi:hypothetical protein